ncbi:uncharacterized protein LOC131688208 [Topomyia yanbarensis]|uniref:uncharacterized protein LOC131688208 n=1 Tax=Topomyia yanbarensis TaxID=2498891 RepID=UPI00273C8793|nr:uncharacterized protein LOC131688208 [Topomyia yanbarensis]
MTECSSEEEVYDEEPRRSASINAGPTRAQLAARQVISKKLPNFSGNPEEWPMFVSSFMNANEACGFSNVENLIRLQESLRGPALEAVRSRLLLPEAVPKVMKTLQLLYGRPEQLLHTLLLKVRKAENPKLDRLNTFIQFGLVVQQLCDHLEAAALRDHLVNPMLLQELIDKLPSQTKLEWVRYKRNQRSVTLRTLSDFLSQIVSEASEVTLFSEAFHQPSRVPKDNSRTKRFDPEGFLNAPSEAENASQDFEPHDYDQFGRGNRQKPCKICNRTDHKVRYCEEFTRLPLNERLQAVRQWKLCHICLNDHGQAPCKFKTRCNVGNCREKHNALIHQDGIERMADCNIHSTMSSQPIIFRMVPVVLRSGQRTVQVMAFLDEGSSYSLVERTLSDQLKAEGAWQPIRVRWTAGMSRMEKNSRCIHLSISGTTSSESFDLKDVHTVEKLQLPHQSLRFVDVAARYEHLQGLPVADYQHGAPQILIGLKHLHVYAPIDSRVGNPGEPIAVKTKLGWTVYGPQDEGESHKIFSAHHTCELPSNQELHDLLRSHYAVEETGIAVTVLLESGEERRAREILEKTTVRTGDRFVTGLLWRQDDVAFPDSFPMALKRLKSLERKLSKDPALETNVKQQISEYTAKGYAHKATDDELQKIDSSKVWYLPINVVLNPKKPGKIRLVWDASASVRGVSLNSLLLKGPDLLTCLPTVISRFRERRVGFGGDIKEMYHQLRIRYEDQHAQRFLFRSNPQAPPDVYVMQVATFGSTCSPCSAQFIKNLNAAEYAGIYPDAAEAIIDKHYVDDYFDSTDTIEEAVTRAKQVRYVHSKAGFTMRNWLSNETDLLRQLGEPEGGEQIHFHRDKQTDHERVLGIVWDPQDDVFMFSTELRKELQPFVYGDRRPTKRAVLSIVMSMFDPLGLLAAFTVFGKMIIQDLWRLGCDWDEEINDQSYRKWTQWLALLPIVEGIKIPRFYFKDILPLVPNALQLHIFVDASESAYGCVAFLRTMTPNGPHSVLVMAKTKVAPLKQLTIPRLELQAAVLGSRLFKTIKESHTVEIKQCFMWTDSSTVLSWIQSDQRKYKQFVAFRIGEILTTTNLDDWRWLPTKYNIADVVTKWGSGPQLESNSAWFKGPSILNEADDDWPASRLPPAGVNEEMRPYFFHHDIEFPQSLIDPTRISRWNVLVRTIACVLRFVANCRRKVKKLPIVALTPTPKVRKLIRREIPAIRTGLKQEEYKHAEEILFGIAQRDAFPDELKILVKNQDLSTTKRLKLEKDSPLAKLSPILIDSNIIRMEGRTAKAEFLPFEMRFPVILPNGHPISQKLIEHYHCKFGHGNRETVANEVRQRFCIPHLRAAIKKVMKSSVWCKVRNCKPVTPKMAPLPIQRLTPFRRPFSFVGLDYLGPLHVTVGRRTEKRWVALFTCLTTRAVHLEVAYSLTTEACVMAFRRFVCRRGFPSEVFSDNGTNLVGASKEICRHVLQIQTGCAEVFTDARTRWNFNPPAAPHMGGCWERLVRSVKEALKVFDDGRRLTDEVLLTTITEAEDIINSRPLTYIPQESAEFASITPNHFLRGFPSEIHIAVPPPTCEAEALRDDYKRSQRLADLLWSRWIKEYLPSINHRTKWHDEQVPIEIGDLVYLVDENNRRAWTRGIVEELIFGKDGRVRQVMVKTRRGIFRRPVSKLAVLEIRSKFVQSMDLTNHYGLGVVGTAGQ